MDMKTYLVGGAVRDMIMGIEAKDKDYVVIGATPEIMLASGYTQVGADFPVFLHPETNEEYALARTERKNGRGYNGFVVDFSKDVTLEEDLARRDLTMNAMALSSDPSLTIIDPFNGMQDIDNCVLRHTSPAFAEDPVRILRIARFAARYKFNVALETMTFMKDMVANGDMKDLTSERVWKEFEKGLMEENPEIMLSTLIECGAHKDLPLFFCKNNITGSLDGLISAVEDSLPLEARFALIATNFRTEQEYVDARIPSDCKELSKLINNEASSVFKYFELTVAERLQLFNRCDLFRKRPRFELMIQTLVHVGNHCGFKRFDVPVHKIHFDMEKALGVDAGVIALSLEDKSKIKDTIFMARVKAMSEE